MAIGTVVTAVPALWIKEGSLRVPRESITARRTDRALDGGWLDLLSGFCVNSVVTKRRAFVLLSLCPFKRAGNLAPFAKKAAEESKAESYG
jgi:hypothetical protein